MTRSRRPLFTPALLVAALLAPLGARPVASASPHPTSEATRRELTAVCERLRKDNFYFGREVVADLERDLAAAPAQGVERIVLNGRLGLELFRLGRLDAAIERLEAGLGLAESEGLPDSHELHGRLIFNLALVYLQRGERRNCVERHAAGSCILPIAESAVHSLPADARRAGDLYLRLLASDPENLHARWLLNLARMISGDAPAGVPPELRLPAEALAGAETPAWRDVAPELGVAAFDLSGGAIIEDFDGDGLLDIVASSSEPCEPLHAWRNDGAGGFEPVAEAWGLDGQLGGLNLVQADFDNDGMVDLLVLRGAWLGAEGRIRNSLLRNDLDREAGGFVDVTAAAGLAYPAYPTQTAAWADYDGDGDLDLYVGNEALAAGREPRELFGAAGRPYPSQLFRNNGDGTFTDVARQAGVTNERFAKGVAWGDFDNDGDPDLYVSVFGLNRLYRNEGDGTFTDVAAELGVTAPERNSFPTWFFDFDNDGDLDIFAADYNTPPAEVVAAYFGRPASGGQPLLYRNDGDRFTEVSARLGLDRATLPMGSNYGDFDNDGWLDIYLGTGEPAFGAIMPNLAYRNRGGTGFEDVTFAGGFGHLQKGHGVAFGDLDNDGDQDLYEQMGGAYPYDAYGNVLYENPGNGNAWITLRLVGTEANRFGVGARIEIVTRTAAGRRSIHVLAGGGGSFGGSSLQQEIGLGAALGIESIVIKWPGSGAVQTFAGVAPNRVYHAVEGAAELERVDLPRLRFAAGSAREPHHH